jgi:hypothetical protein
MSAHTTPLGVGEYDEDRPVEFDEAGEPCVVDGSENVSSVE